MVARAGDPRGTARWQRMRKQIIAASDVCHLCGHTGAGDVDHIIPIELGCDPFDWDNCAPAHGVRSRCWQCDGWRGRACNQARRRRRGSSGRSPRLPPPSRRW